MLRLSTSPLSGSRGRTATSMPAAWYKMRCGTEAAGPWAGGSGAKGCCAAGCAADSPTGSIPALVPPGAGPDDDAGGPELPVRDVPAAWPKAGCPFPVPAPAPAPAPAPDAA
ncbi:hypothetical protein BJQ90_00715 [Arthrobacter sp. SO3]|nr:hypothetical protein [Arthrobacter sp. SO3]